MALKIGDKVKNIHDGKIGRIVYSTFGASITGFSTEGDGERYHFQTIGQPIENYEKDWEKIDE